MQMIAGKSMRTAKANAPNILIVLLDDVGFGQVSTFGGPVNTPTLQRLADEGVRYNRFHTTARCSPSRVALLTGRNHHSVHTGCITELSTGFPGYDGILPKDAALAAETLKQNGYNTYCVGKWHLAPKETMTAAGPYDRWPLGRGFEGYYGFLVSGTHQYMEFSPPRGRDEGRVGKTMMLIPEVSEAMRSDLSRIAYRWHPF